MKTGPAGMELSGLQDRSYGNEVRMERGTIGGAGNRTCRI